MRFDVIGDIHGEFDKLTSLLGVLGYAESGGIRRHPERTAVFVGDLIDRGPQQLETVGMVRSMVEAGAARCILGNHEFNAIAWVTPDPDRPGHFLRDHHKPGNRAQHQAFLDVVEGTPRQKEITDWFRTLPLWLDLGGLRVVHACWHEESMGVLRPVLGPDESLTDDAILLGSRQGHPVFDALEVVCKGPEVPLPEGVSFTDKGGKVRHEVVTNLAALVREGNALGQGSSRGPGSVVAGGFVDISQGGNRSAGRHGNDSGCAVAGRMEGAPVFRSTGTVWTLLVYGHTERDFTAVCLSGLQRGEGRTVGGVSVGWRDGAIVGKAGVGMSKVCPLVR